MDKHLPQSTYLILLYISVTSTYMLMERNACDGMTIILILGCNKLKVNIMSDLCSVL
jgi:hypothetical protein